LRAQWIAKTIKAHNPDVITLNELTNWVATSTSGVNLPNYDYLPILQDALRTKA
jgi:hypothetical protein